MPMFNSKLKEDLSLLRGRIELLEDKIQSLEKLLELKEKRRYIFSNGETTL